MRKILTALNFISPLFLLLPTFGLLSSGFYLLTLLPLSGLLSSLYCTFIIFKKEDHVLTPSETIVASYSTVVIITIGILLAATLGIQ